MALMCSDNTRPGTSQSESFQTFRDILIQQASSSIQYGLKHGYEGKIDPQQFPQPLQQIRSCFVTLEINGKLRGCIGTLEATRPLIADVYHNAYAVAFSDPRFPSLQEKEFPLIEIHISILGTPEPMSFESEKDLITQIRPNIDGLILEAEGHRGTFLPSVWESLPDTGSFLTHLKMKAGLPGNYWSEHIRICRYTTEMIT